MTTIKVFEQIALVALLMALMSGIAEAENRARTKIGVTVGLTGNLASIGTGIRNAIQLAEQENDLADNIEFLIEDDGFDPKRTVAAVRKFLDVDKVAGLIVFGSGSALAVNNLAEERRIPMIALGNSKKIIAGKRYVMMHFLNTDTENAVVVEEVRRRGLKDIAVICTSHDAMIDLSKAFVEALSDRVVLSLELLPGDTDFRAAVTRIKANRAEAVYNVLLPGTAGLFAKKLREAGFQGELFSAHAVDDLQEVRSADGALDGTWFVTGNVISDPAFVSRYQKAFNESPKVATPNGYDAAKLFIAAAGSHDINQYFRELKDFKGVMGTYGLNAAGYFDLPAALKKITAGGFEPLR